LLDLFFRPPYCLQLFLELFLLFLDVFFLQLAISVILGELFQSLVDGFKPASVFVVFVQILDVIEAAGAPLGLIFAFQRKIIRVTRHGLQIHLSPGLDGSLEDWFSWQLPARIFDQTPGCLQRVLARVC